MLRLFPKLVVGTLAAVLTLGACGDVHPDSSSTVRVGGGGHHRRTPTTSTKVVTHKIDWNAINRYYAKAIALAVAIHNNEVAASSRAAASQATVLPRVGFPTAATSTPPPVPVQTGPGFAFAVMDPALRPFFQCIVEHESIDAGGYRAVAPGGKYQGAFQADANFVRAYAPAGAKHFADTGNWYLMDPADQDRMAMAGYAARGPQPWQGDHCG